MRDFYEKIQLKDACEVFADGDWIESKDQSNEGIRLVQTGNIGFGFFKDKEDKARYISEETFERLKCTEILPGDLLVSRLPDPVGKSCIIPEIDSKMITGVDCTIIRPKGNLASEFLGYYQMSHQYLKDVLSSVSGATRQRISRKNLGLIQIPLPPLPEQKQIVSILDKAFAAIDKAIANAEQNLQNAKELFDNSQQLLFDNNDWEKKKLGEIADFKNGMNYTKSSKGQSIEIVGVKDFKKNFYVPSKSLEKVVIDGEMNESYLMRKGDIITVRSNGNPQLIGRTLLAKDVEGSVSHSGFTIRIRLKPNTLLPVFLCYYLKTANTRKELVDSGNGVGIRSLNQGALSSLLVPYPKTVSEQEQIVERLEKLSIQTKNLQSIYTQKLLELEELKKSILQQAFSGQLTTK